MESHPIKIQIDNEDFQFNRDENSQAAGFGGIQKGKEAVKVHGAESGEKRTVVAG